MRGKAVDLLGDLITIGGLPFAIVCLVIVALIRGDFVIRRSHEALVQEKDEAILREREHRLLAQEHVAELWHLLEPTIMISEAALAQMERERTEKLEREKEEQAKSTARRRGKDR